MQDLFLRNLAAITQRAGRGVSLGTPLLPLSAWSDETPAAAAVRLREEVGSRRPATLFVIGSGGGAILDAIEAANPEAEVVLLEPDPGPAERLLKNRDLTIWVLTGRLTLLVGPDYQGATGSWRPDTVPKQSPPLLVLPEVADRLPVETQDAERLVQRLVEEARGNADARRAHASRYLLQTLANASSIAREGDVASLTGAFPRTPAIVVGAGPSLDGHLAALAAVADRAVIIACAAAARPLMAAGITPRFIIAVDPSESNGAHLAGLQNARASWLVAEGSVHPPAFAAYDRRTFVFNVSDHHPWPWLAGLGIRRGRLATWGSVATSALDFALGLGCSPILFAGLDFAFTGGRPYCRGTTFESQWALWMAEGHGFEAICQQAISRWPVALEPDAEGRLVRTAPHLVSFRNWMRQRIESSSRVRFKQVTPGGILHHPCIEQTTAEDALANAERLDGRQIDARIRVLHRATSPAVERLFHGIDRLLESEPGEGGDDPRDAWIAFSGRTLRREVFAAALVTHEHEAWRKGQLSTLIDAVNNAVLE